MISPREIQTCVLGDTGVGKSSIIYRFTNDKFRKNIESTLGAAFMSRTINLKENDAIKFQIWDTAGQEKFHALAPIYYRNAQVAILVYDITSRSSFKAINRWITELQQKGSKDIIIAIVGNKLDLEENEEISYDEASEIAQQYNALHKRTSAKENTNILELFLDIGKKIQQSSQILNQSINQKVQSIQKSKHKVIRKEKGNCPC